MRVCFGAGGDWRYIYCGVAAIVSQPMRGEHKEDCETPRADARNKEVMKGVANGKMRQNLPLRP